MTEAHPAREAVIRAGKRAAYHLMQALVESLKAVEAVIEEIGSIGEDGTERDDGSLREKIEIE
ncbi:MAG: hypothetical protein ACE5F5_03970 [Acidimicrobiia bacterium]